MAPRPRTLILVLLAGAGAGIAGLAASHSKAFAITAATDVCVARATPDGGRPESGGPPSSPVLSPRLALGSLGVALSDDERRSLRDALETSVSGWEARSRPLVGDGRRAPRLRGSMPTERSRV